jgi:hypothetical protein
MTEQRKLLKEARDLLLMCTFIDKSGQCTEMVEKIDGYLNRPSKRVKVGGLISSKRTNNGKQ